MRFNDQNACKFEFHYYSFSIIKLKSEHKLLDFELKWFFIYTNNHGYLLDKILEFKLSCKP